MKVLSRSLMFSTAEKGGGGLVEELPIQKYGEKIDRNINEDRKKREMKKKGARDCNLTLSSHSSFSAFLTDCYELPSHYLRCYISSRHTHTVGGRAGKRRGAL